MNRYITTILIVVLLALGGNTYLVLDNAGKLAKQVTVVCAEHKTMARIAKEEAEEGAVSQKNVLPHINIPGLTHEELLKLTEEKEARKQTRAAELALISSETC